MGEWNSRRVGDRHSTDFGGEDTSPFGGIVHGPEEGYGEDAEAGERVEGARMAYANQWTSLHAHQWDWL